MLLFLTVFMYLFIAPIASAQDCAAYYMVLDEAINYNYLIAVDSSTNGNNGTCTSSNILALSGADWEGNFDGTNYISVADSTSLDFAGASKMSVAVWIYPTDLTDINSFAGLVVKGGYGPNSGFELFQNVDRPQWGGGIGCICFNLYRDQIWTETVPPINTWTHIAACNDGSTSYIYVNGTQDVSAAASTYIDNNLSLFIGQRDPATARATKFKGKMDDAILWDSCLTSNQVYNLAQGSMPTNIPVLIFRFIPEEL